VCQTRELLNSRFSSSTPRPEPVLMFKRGA
jgi:hypothetical protein